MATPTLAMEDAAMPDADDDLLPKEGDDYDVEDEMKKIGDAEDDALYPDVDGDDRTPVERGFRMPGEWEPHKQTWMGWPIRPDNWREHAGPAQRAYAAVAHAINEFEPVTVCVPHVRFLDAAKKLLPSQVEVLVIPQDDAWFRDTGPSFIVSETDEGPEKRVVAGVHWRFNAWGGLYEYFRNDGRVAPRILWEEGLQCFRSYIVLEGGSIHVDGEGTLLTTEECLLNPNRNPYRTKKGLEFHLAEMLNIKKFIWLPYGLYGDTDTSGHIDNMACFARPGVVLLNWTDDHNNPQYERSKAALDVLTSTTDAKGRNIEVITVPIPPTLHYTKEEAAGLVVSPGNNEREPGEELAASYINFYLPNGGVVMPAFGGDATQTDAQAKEILQRVFPDRKVVAVPTRDILLGGGNIHCITQQQPAGPGALHTRDHGPKVAVMHETESRL